MLFPDVPRHVKSLTNPGTDVEVWQLTIYRSPNTSDVCQNSCFLAAPLDIGPSDLFKDTAKQHVTASRVQGNHASSPALQGWTASRISSSNLTAVTALSFIPCT